MPVIPVKKVTIITFTDYEEEILRDLGQLGVVDLKPLREEEYVGFKKAMIEEIHKYMELLDRLRTLYEKLKDHKFVKPPTTKITTKVSIVELETKITYYEKELSGIEARISKLQQYIEELHKNKEFVRMLANFDINPGDLGEFEHIFTHAVIADKNTVDALKRALITAPRIIMKEYELDKDKYLIVIAGLIEYKDDVKKIFRTLNVEEIKLPSNIPKKSEEALKWIEEEISRVNDEIKSLKQNYERLKDQFFSEAGFFEKALIYSLNISKAQSKMLRSKMMSVLEGWVPTDMIENLNKYVTMIREKLKGRIMVTFSDPAPDEHPPTVLRNPKLFKAYESLVRQFGVPDPHETDPTIVSGVLWTLMFGFMFPDLGQGIVIAILGFIFAFVMKRRELMGIPIKTVGKLMIGAGLVAAFFGALIGDFFLLEHVIEPLWPGLAPGWLEKAVNIVWLIKLAVYFGIIQITIGLFLATYNNLRHGHKVEALLGERGIAGLITFWSIVLIAFAFLGINVIPGVLEFPGVNLAEYLGAIVSNPAKLMMWPNITLTIPIITLLIGIIAMILKGIIEREEIALTFGSLFETLLSFFANMLSFVRLAGFNIAHVALAVVIAKMLEVSQGLGYGMLIFMNVFALTLELVIVMIQALRLTFYEFMTKFYQGTGKLYRPFKIRI